MQSRKEVLVVNEEKDAPICPYCGNTMLLVSLSGEYPPDLQHQYECFHCQAAAPKGTTEEDAYKRATTLKGASI